ncbi:globin family protein [Spirosoma knui]
MTFEQARLVRKTYQRVADVAPEAVGQVFYNRLFDIAPELQIIFGRAGLPEQSIQLMAMLTYVVSRLNNVDSMVEDAAVLARYYEHRGITEQHYTYVGQALLWTLERALDADWTPEVKEAWTVCYTLLAEIMSSAVQSAITAPGPSEPYPLSYAPGY